MSLPARHLNLSADDYLAIEARSNVRHEFIGGQMFAMAGASDAHNVIAGNVFAILRMHLRGSGCRAYIADMKAKIEKTEDFYYPDVMATGEKFAAKSVFKSQPFLIFEILSPSTASIDRREKLAAYRQIDNLREYVVIYQDKKRAELHRKDSRGNWQTAILGAEDELYLESPPNDPLTITMNEIYEDVDFTQAESDAA
jgi:Uma2 family endonuclease